MTENVGAAIGRPQCESYVFAGNWCKNLCFTAGRAMLAPTVSVEKSFFDMLKEEPENSGSPFGNAVYWSTIKTGRPNGAGFHTPSGC